MTTVTQRMVGLKLYLLSNPLARQIVLISLPSDIHQSPSMSHRNQSTEQMGHVAAFFPQQFRLFVTPHVPGLPVPSIHRLELSKIYNIFRKHVTTKMNFLKIWTTERLMPGQWCQIADSSAAVLVESIFFDPSRPLFRPSTRHLKRQSVVQRHEHRRNVEPDLPSGQHSDQSISRCQDIGQRMVGQKRQSVR